MKITYNKYEGGANVVIDDKVSISHNDDGSLWGVQTKDDDVIGSKKTVLEIVKELLRVS